jgi:hypothetical protein
VLALAYALPHAWWMFGVSLAFPGDSAELEFAFERTWFAVYNVVATGLVLLGATGVVAVESSRVTGRRRRLLIMMLFAATVLLLLRGALGLVSVLIALAGAGVLQEPVADQSVSAFALLWEAWFLAMGGTLLSTALRHRDRVPRR